MRPPPSDRPDLLIDLNRRRFLTGLAASPLAAVSMPVAASATSALDISVRQNGEEVAKVSPITSDRSIEDFYRYDRIDNASANTPMHLRESDVTKLFFYRRSGTNSPLSLVVIHDTPHDGDGGSVRFDFQPNALPSGGGWAVEDDPGETFTRNVADWSWVSCCTDGGAYRGGFEEGVEVTIDPSFNSGIGRWDLLDADGSVAAELSRTAPVTLTVGTAEEAAVVRKQQLIDTIRAEAGQIMLEARAEQLDERAEALLAEIDQALSDEEETFQYEEALDRMLTAERVTQSGTAIGADPAREISKSITELLIMLAFVVFAKGLLHKGGRAGSVVAAKLDDLAAKAERGVQRLAGRPVLPPSAKRTLDDVIDEVNRRVDEWLREHAAGLEAAGEEIVSGAGIINDVFDLLADEVVDALASIKGFAVQALTVLFYDTYMTDMAAYDEEGNRTEPPGIDSSIDTRMGDLGRAIEDERLEAGGAADREQAQQDRIAAFQEQRQTFLEGMQLFDDVIGGASLAVLVLAAIAIALYAISAILSATGVGLWAAGVLAAAASSFVSVAAGIGTFVIGLTAFSVFLGFGFLNNRQAEHDATVDFIVNYETH